MQSGNAFNIFHSVVSVRKCYTSPSCPQFCEDSCVFYVSYVQFIILFLASFLMILRQSLMTLKRLLNIRDHRDDCMLNSVRNACYILLLCVWLHNFEIPIWHKQGVYFLPKEILANIELLIKSNYEFCRNIGNFCFRNINYRFTELISKLVSF